MEFVGDFVRGVGVVFGVFDDWFEMVKMLRVYQGFGVYFQVLFFLEFWQVLVDLFCWLKYFYGLFFVGGVVIYFGVVFVVQFEMFDVQFSNLGCFVVFLWYFDVCFLEVLVVRFGLVLFVDIYCVENLLFGQFEFLVLGCLFVFYVGQFFEEGVLNFVVFMRNQVIVLQVFDELLVGIFDVQIGWNFFCQYLIGVSCCMLLVCFYQNLLLLFGLLMERLVRVDGERLIFVIFDVSWVM